jgi:hypothetical protein
MRRTRCVAPPVPAGISRPTMTFSFRPTSLSRLPCTEASVSTRVVSWKDAAEMKDRVCSDALVIPSRIGSPCAGGRPWRSPSRWPRRTRLVDVLALQKRRLPAVEDLPLLQHLADDHLDVLVVDLHALQPVDVLHLVDQVVRQRLDPHDPQDVMRRGVAVHDVVALLDEVALGHGDVLALGHHVLDRPSRLSSAGTMAIRRLFL